MYDGSFRRFGLKQKLLFHEVFFEIKISTSGKQFCHFDPYKSKSVFIAAMKDLFVVCREFRVQDPKLNSARGPGFDSQMQGQSGAVLYTGCAQ